VFSGVVLDNPRAGIFLAKDNVMKSATIPGNKWEDPKTFTVGEVYWGETQRPAGGLFGSDILIQITDVKDGRIYWRDIFRGTTGSFVSKQFTRLSKSSLLVSTSQGKRDLLVKFFIMDLSYLTK